MSNHEIAIKEYLQFIYGLHKLNSEKIDYFVDLPSVKCESRTEIRDIDDVLLKVYKTHGHMKFTFLKFYKNYASNLTEFSNSYCHKHKIKNPEISFDMLAFENEVKTTIHLLESKLDTKPTLSSDSNKEIIDVIYLMFESIDALMSLEYKLCAVPNYDNLDVLKETKFKLFKSNQLFYRVRNILHSFPQSGYYNATKTSFLYPLDKLTESQN